MWNVGEEYSIKLIRHCQWINFSEGFGNKSWIFGAKGWLTSVWGWHPLQESRLRKGREWIPENTYSSDVKIPCILGERCYSCWPCSAYSKQNLLLDQPGYSLFWRCRVTADCSTLSDLVFKLNWYGLIMNMLPPVLTVWYPCSRGWFSQCMWSLIPYVTEREQTCPFPLQWLHFDS